MLEGWTPISCIFKSRLILNLLGLKRDAAIVNPQSLGSVNKCFANPSTNNNLLL